jgi:PKD repeat protein
MKRSSLLFGALCALALGASTAQAQNKLTTIFASNNGLSGTSMVFFDVTVANPVRLTGFELNSYATVNAAVNLQVYTCASTYVGNEQNASAWTQIAQDNGSAVGAGQDVPSAVTLQAPVMLPAGTYGMALVSNGGHRYTNGNGTNQSYGDSFLTLKLGASASATTPFSGSPITPRVWNGSIVYTPAAGIYANFTATPVEGNSPLQVQFTDTTFTDDPAGVSKWEWDFNNDQIIDSTVQNPKWTFTGVGYGVTYTVSLKATDSKNGSNTVTKKDFILVNPFPTATASTFGAGSTNKATNGPIDPGPFNRTYQSSSGTRGFYFQAPTTFVVTGFQVPNEASQPQQAVNFFTSSTMPPAFSSSYQLTANDVKYFAQGVPSGQVLKPTAPIVVQKDEWVGILGACMAASGTTMYNSYGTTGGVTSTVLGQPIQLQRLLYQGTLAGRTDGLVPISTENAYEIARVEIYVAGNSTVPTLDTIGVPALGQTPQFDLQGKIQGLQFGLILVGSQKMPTPIPTGFGNLLIVPNFLLQIPIPGGTGQIGLPIPNDRNIAGIQLENQAVVFDVTNGVYGMTNGVSWLLGQ